MKKLKVMTVFGTRPEAIKMAPLVIELKKADDIESLVCITAQHREMLDMVMNLFKIKADYDLNIMQANQTLAGITTRAIDGLCKVFEEVKPDVVLVHGDTTTTFCGSIAAFYNHIAVGHVEAGLRTYDKYSPFPEEINRCLTGTIADYHFAPTENNKNNLIKENKLGKIFVTGNTVIDATKYTVKPNYLFSNETLKTLDFSKRTILVTAHRRENLGKPLENICKAILDVVNDSPDIQVVYPVHLNPKVRETAFSILGGHDRIHLIDPLDVDELHNLISRSYMVMTDSGGLQEEAPSLGKPVLVLRAETERPEAVTAGTVKMAGCDHDVIYNMAKELIDDKNAYNAMAHSVNPYGDGKASERIVQALRYVYGLSDKAPDEFKL
ncbi:MAG: UDP-N-acetylglucosamine 2-epimerase (non-hydrolyzing) [Bacillota bacterium]|nr:UDP-N-acetylglucosamine 2-epimerase (non-hydrolyzing) [Bacillota bacterium]